MNRLISTTLALLMLGLVSACSDSPSSKYQELSWEDLKPFDEKELEVPSNGSSLVIEDDWYTDDYAQSDGLTGTYSGAPQQTQSFGVVPEINEKEVRVPGFVVPVEFDGDKLVTEFFLVPYFGACFHKPPPAPNQTIYVRSESAVEYQSIYDPVWIMGVIKTEQTGNDIATAAYRMDLHGLEPFDY